MCDEYHPGRPKLTDKPTFRVGCCFDIEWSGTREQAGELYDYLMGQGYLAQHEECANGCIDFDDEEIGGETQVWMCGVCKEEWSEDDWADAKERAMACCEEKMAQKRAEMMEEENV